MQQQQQQQQQQSPPPQQQQQPFIFSIPPPQGIPLTLPGAIGSGPSFSQITAAGTISHTPSDVSQQQQQQQQTGFFSTSLGPNSFINFVPGYVDSAADAGVRPPSPKKVQQEIHSILRVATAHVRAPLRQPTMLHHAASPFARTRAALASNVASSHGGGGSRNNNIGNKHFSDSKEQQEHSASGESSTLQASDHGGGVVASQHSTEKRSSSTSSKLQRNGSKKRSSTSRRRRKRSTTTPSDGVDESVEASPMFRRVAGGWIANAAIRDLLPPRYSPSAHIVKSPRHSYSAESFHTSSNGSSRSSSSRVRGGGGGAPLSSSAPRARRSLGGLDLDQTFESGSTMSSGSSTTLGNRTHGSSALGGGRFARQPTADPGQYSRFQHQQASRSGSSGLLPPPGQEEVPTSSLQSCSTSWFGNSSSRSSSSAATAAAAVLAPQPQGRFYAASSSSSSSSSASSAIGRAGLGSSPVGRCLPRESNNSDHQHQHHDHHYQQQRDSGDARRGGPLLRGRRSISPANHGQHDGGSRASSVGSNTSQAVKQLSKYGIVRTIGSGLSGKVCLVREYTTGATFVAKAMRWDRQAPSGEDPDFLKRTALRDIEMLSNCAHPNIVRFVESATAGTTAFLIMEYLEGGDLAKDMSKRRRTKTPYSLSSVLRYLVQICFALEFLHSQKLSHRDVKPGNIVMRKVVFDPVAYDICKQAEQQLKAQQQQQQNQQSSVLAGAAQQQQQQQQQQPMQFQISSQPATLTVEQLQELNRLSAASNSGSGAGGPSAMILSIPMPPGGSATGVPLVRSGNPTPVSGTQYLGSPPRDAAMFPLPGGGGGGETTNSGRAASHNFVVPPFKDDNNNDDDAVMSSDSSSGEDVVGNTKKSSPATVGLREFFAGTSAKLPRESDDSFSFALGSRSASKDSSGKRHHHHRKDAGTFSSSSSSFGGETAASCSEEEDDDCENSTSSRSGEDSDNSRRNNNNKNKVRKVTVVKLADFGFARRTYEERGDTAGTPHYAAPEMYAHMTHTEKADMFSLGIVLHEMLTLQRPFRNVDFRDYDAGRKLVEQYVNEGGGDSAAAAAADGDGCVLSSDDDWHVGLGVVPDTDVASKAAPAAAVGGGGGGVDGSKRSSSAAVETLSSVMEKSSVPPDVTQLVRALLQFEPAARPSAKQVFTRFPVMESAARAFLKQFRKTHPDDASAIDLTKRFENFFMC